MPFSSILRFFMFDILMIYFRQTVCKKIVFLNGAEEKGCSKSFSQVKSFLIGTPKSDI